MIPYIKLGPAEDEMLDTELYPELLEKGFYVGDLTDKNLRAQVIDGVVKAYKNVFNQSAWKEGVKCSSGCGFKATFEGAPTKCPDCQSGIVDFYSNEEVKGFVDSVIGRSGYKQALALIKKENRLVGGFTWGWNTRLDDLNEQKLDLSSEEYKKLCSSLDNMGVDPEAFLYYQSETGITGENRRKGLGKDLINLNQTLLEKNAVQVKQIIQRTSKSSPMYKIREEQGYKEVFDYNDRDGRVLFAKLNN